MIVRIKKPTPIKVSINSTKAQNVSFNNTVIVNGLGADPYLGAYEVIPSTEDQVLRTKNKGMRDDVTVRSVPFHEMNNEQGGSTVIIGE